MLILILLNDKKYISESSKTRGIYCWQKTVYIFCSTKKIASEELFHGTYLTCKDFQVRVITSECGASGKVIYCSIFSLFTS